MPDTDRFRLAASDLRWSCDPASLGCDGTDDVPALARIVGQERALRAIRLGLAIRERGYNVFVTGNTGTGRSTTIKRLLEEYGGQRALPPDIVYVHNFKDPDSPSAVFLAAGLGRALQRDMAELVQALRKNMPVVLEGEEYQRRQRELVQRHEARQKETVQRFEREVEAERFALVQMGGDGGPPELVPLVDGKPVAFEELEARVEAEEFPRERLEKLRAAKEKLVARFRETMKGVAAIGKELREQAKKLEDEFLRPLVQDAFEALRQKYAAPGLNTYLDSAAAAILDNPAMFRDGGHEAGPVMPLLLGLPKDDPLKPFQINVVVDNAETRSPPVVLEDSPTFKNLFGTIERTIDRQGNARADHMGIRAGSLLRANGGYLIVNLFDAISELGVWPILKRTLRNGRTEIRTLDSLYFSLPLALKPEPVEIDVKVVVIGDSWSYQVLHDLDPDFSKVFKVRADFDHLMPRDPDGISAYACFVRKIVDEEHLPPFDASGIAAMVEHGVRLAGRRSKLSTRFAALMDLLREAAHFARDEGSARVERRHVERALEERRFRLGLHDERVRELIREAILLVDTQGSVVGQVNGLSVVALADAAFGHPVRITARTAMGRGGIVNIEREVELSGRIHSKGVLILGGFLHGRFGASRPLSLSATIAFEQSYGGVDGDSASSTELYALLSSLAGLPLRQDVAVTGSVNQLGEVQAIGGVNEKIEGFFAVCKDRGLTGTQGVLIPRANVEDLMLRPEVVSEVAAGRFHIWAVRHVDEGIEILTGVPAGERDAQGRFPPDSVNGRVEARLSEFAERLRSFGKES